MNIGLVLAGGMAKGAYQIGALRAITNFLPLSEIKFVSCASIGVLNGYAYVTDNLDGAEDMWKNLCKDNAKFFITQILKSSVLQKNIVELYESSNDLSSTFYCSLLDISHRNIVYKDLSTVGCEQVSDYLKASVAMPVYNRAVQIDGTSYYDGAMIDNIPVYPLLKHDPDYIICIYFDDTCYKFESKNIDNKIIKITFPCKSVVKQSLVFKKESIEQMISDGYDRSMEVLEKVFSKGYKNLDHIYSAIEDMNVNTKNNSLRITGDVLVTNLNKITQKLTKKKVL